MQTLLRVYGKHPFDGQEIKAVLKNSADSTSLTEDRMNAFDKYHSKDYLFGKGLVNARLASGWCQLATTQTNSNT